MDDILKFQKKIIPEMTELLQKRYDILRNVYYHQPVGRRTLANNLGVGERVIRTEVNILQKQGLLEINPVGMTVTAEGIEVIDHLKEFIHSLKGLAWLEKSLQDKLGIDKVIVVPGNYDEDEYVLRDICKAATRYIYSKLKDKSIVGITGGSTMAQVAEDMPQQQSKKDVLVIPARGGIGRNLEAQSNNVAARFAQKLGGSYKLLHVPDNIGKEALETLLNVPEIKELIDLIKKINLFVFGIGRADQMARRRELSKEDIEDLLKSGAVSEAFGYYFNIKGNIVRESSTVGISLEDFKEIDRVVGIAGGEKKADAIMAITSLRKHMTIVTDEGAAREILKRVN